jgi:hypothetical protein
MSARDKLAGGVVGVIVALVVGALALGSLVSINRTRTYILNSCRTGNLARGDTYLDSLQPEDKHLERVRARALYYIRDCDASLKQKRPVPVALDVQRRYLELINQDPPREPILKDGKIVGTVPLRRP